VLSTVFFLSPFFFVCNFTKNYFRILFQFYTSGISDFGDRSGSVTEPGHLVFLLLLTRKPTSFSCVAFIILLHILGATGIINNLNISSAGGFKSIDLYLCMFRFVFVYFCAYYLL